LSLVRTNVLLYNFKISIEKQERKMDLLKGLNKEQKEAVMHTEGPLLILAGAGSGKTRVLTHRIAYLIKEKNVNPGRILAITFTNKAANEMKERVEGILGETAKDMWISTFHSACVRILRRHIDRIGFKRNFVIYDSADQKTLIQDCMKEINVNERLYDPKAVLNAISRAKDELIEPDRYMKMNESDFRSRVMGEIYALYQKKLRLNNALDFDDILFYTIKLFIENNDVLQLFQNQFRYIMVDEYQDTNTAQYHLVSLLAQKHRNICVVGDDDQSIYLFRGANIRNILDFEKEFKDCRVIKLEQNYRSTQTILKAAYSVIRNNKERKDKKLWTQNIEGEKIKSFEGDNEHAEAVFVASEIKHLCSKGKNYRDFAVLYRMNAQSRVIEDTFIREGIPYKIVGGLRFYDRKEIKDVLAYLRVIQNPGDTISLKRIINTPRRGIGSTTLERAEEIASINEDSIYNVIRSSNLYPELQRASSKLDSFCNMIEEFTGMKDQIPVSELIGRVIEVSGLLSELEKEDTIEANSRIENIKELISVALEFEAQENSGGLEDFLAQISLVSDIDGFSDKEDSVVLMTLHSAKGLEFPVVFITGMEEGVFPSYRSVAYETQLEEERRLCYVGITRAKELLYLVNAKSRTLFGSTSFNLVSRFKEEVDSMLLEDANRTSSKGSVFTGGFAANGFIKQTKNEKPNFDFCEGDMVVHRKFGVGIIVSIEEVEDDFKVEIQFRKSGMKRLMAKYANLVKL